MREGWYKAPPVRGTPFPPTQDYGYPQSTSTEMLKMYVHNEPIAVENPRSGATHSKKTMPSSAVQKPISMIMTVSQAAFQEHAHEIVCFLSCSSAVNEQEE